MRAASVRRKVQLREKWALKGLERVSPYYEDLNADLYWFVALEGLFSLSGRPFAAIPVNGASSKTRSVSSIRNLFKLVVNGTFRVD
jgi:hypothetical protein